MTEQNTIEVLILEAQETLPGRRMAPSAAGTIAARVVPMSTEAVVQSIQKVTDQVGEIVRALPSDDATVSLDEVSVGLTVSGEGNVQWVVGIGVAVGSTVTLTYKVADTRDNGGA